jgi:hypothetical protein
MVRNSQNPPQKGGDDYDGYATGVQKAAVKPVAEEEWIGHLQFSRPRTSTPLRTQAISPLAWAANISPKGDGCLLDTHPASISAAIAANVSFITALPIRQYNDYETTSAAGAYAPPCDRGWSVLSSHTGAHNRPEARSG